MKIMFHIPANHDISPSGEVEVRVLVEPGSPVPRRGEIVRLHGSSMPASPMVVADVQHAYEVKSNSDDNEYVCHVFLIRISA